MSDDIATLGLAVDSSQAATAATNLNRLQVAAATCENSVGDLGSTLAASVGDLNVLATAQKNGTTLFDAGSTSLRGQRLVLRGLAGDLALLGPQYGQAAGMAALLYLDNAHLVGGFGGLKSAIASVITPTNLLIGGFVGVAAGGLLAYNAIKQTELQFGELSERTATTVQQLHALESVSSFKGIDTADFLKSMTQFGDLSAQASNNMGTLAELFRANGAASGTMTDNLYIAADLIHNSTSDAQKYQIIQQLGLPATREWVQYLSQGSVGLKQAAADAAQFGNTADEQLIAKARQADEAWNTTWKNFSNNGKAAFTNIMSGMGSLIQWWQDKVGGLVDPLGVLKVNMQSGGGTRLTQTSANAFYDATGAGQSASTKPTVDPNVEKNKIAAQQQYIGLLGQTSTIDQQIQSVELQIQSYRLNPASISLTETQIANLKRLAAERALGIDAIKASTDAQKTEADTVGMSVGEAATYTAVQNRLNEAKRNGQTLTVQNVADIQREADALGQAAQRTDTLKFGYDTFSGTMRDFGQNLRNGQNAWVAFQNAGVNALGKIADKLMDMASQQLWKAAFPTGGGGLFSLLGLSGSTATGGNYAVNSTSGAVIGANGMLAGGAHTGIGPGDPWTFTRNVPAATFDNAPRFHSGIGPGEQAAIIRTDESVLTPGQMKQLSPAGGATIHMSPTYVFQNADPGSEARMRAYVDQTSKQTKTDTIAAFIALQRNSPSATRPQ